MSNIEEVCLSESMKKSYIEYAIDVIQQRALPDVRDGLKPVHRRILYALHTLKLTPNVSYKKSARIVGEVLGKYHPHGDSSVYDALVRMAQDFSMRYPLVDGHGNFGSIDGDSAAAMRYTEAKMNRNAAPMLYDINKNTVDFIPNFDGEEEEPVVLPSRFPNLLVNGSSGIAVGMATNIPPHNLREVIDGVIFQLDNPNCTIDELMEYIKAPDFPTGANIVNSDNLKEIYKQGNGKIILRATHHIENIKDKNKEKECIVFTDVPYQVNKGLLVENIYNLSRNIEKTERGKKKIIPAKIPEITEVRDESDREGIRIVVELKRKGDSHRVLNLLYKYSKIQINFNVNNVALVNGLPKENLSLKELVYFYIEHQKDILIKRTTFDKNKAEKTLHIYKGLQVALDKLDYTINLIKESKNRLAARESLIKNLNIDEIQADSILEMKLQRLTNLEKENILIQIKELEEKIKEYNDILDNESSLIKVLKQELLEIKDKYGDDRRTKITNKDTIIDQDALIEKYNTVIQLTQEGYIKKLRATSIKNTNKDRLKDNDIIISEIRGNNKDWILLFSDLGNVYKIKASELIEKKSNELGEVLTSYFEFEKNENIISVASTQFGKDEYIIKVFENGNVGKINISSYNKSIKVLKGKDSCKVISIKHISDNVDILLMSSEGKALIINTDMISNVSSRDTKGVVGIKLNDNNKLIGCIIGVKEDTNISIQSKKGKTKTYMLDDVSPNENKSIYEYILGRRGREGNFLYNTRINNDEIINFKIGFCD